MGGGGKGGGGKQTTTTTAEPWSGVKPFLTEGYQDLSNQYKQGAPGYYPGGTVAGMSPYTSGALQMQAVRALQGSPLTGAAQDQLTRTMQGDYVAQLNPSTSAAQGGLANIAGGGQLGALDPAMQAAQDQQRATIRGDYLNAGNPYLQGAVDAATRPLVDSFQRNIMPAIDSQFSAAGRYGSGAHGGALGEAIGQQQRAIGDVASNMAFGNYSAERGLQQHAADAAAQNYNAAANRQMQGIGQAFQNWNAERDRQNQGMFFAPQLAQQDYFDINQLGASGSAVDAYNQALLDADIGRYNYGQNADWVRTQDYLGTLLGAPWGSTSTTSQPRPSAFSSALGGGLQGASQGAAFGPWGALAGGVLGAGAGLLNRSDARVKTDIVRVGTLDNGLPVYRFRYIDGGPVQLGVMAQDVVALRPDAVHDIDGVLHVDYARATEG
ncbi:tail fiber domain-containing protein [Vineibacter terrae]|uniref:tail fiber domain-containing protein n=1 Tax=Vineibacter terrae TaxID=2586908 RepID=UPI002E310F8F|nr:tail fiber domain-containing protein [Vineibacter terrae]HEX2887170.1 tail fiber domain-containing protein [Vineibacter terrae]